VSFNSGEIGTWRSLSAGGGAVVAVHPLGVHGRIHL